MIDDLWIVKEINNLTYKEMKILVVHRQKETVVHIKKVLSRSNPVVIHTESGLDGLLTSRIEHFDLIICGTDLPVITGFELVRSIRTHSVNRNTPVVFIADEVTEKTQHLGSALGAAAMLAEAEVDRQLAGIVDKSCLRDLSEDSGYYKLN
jgi:CheY-like chemotaxis protein